MRHADEVTWYELSPADESFFSTASIVHRFPIELDVSPERVWQSISSDESLAAWVPGVQLRWTSPRPFDIGATREVVLPLRAMRLRERFFRWDEGAGFSFFVEEANRPLMQRFAEDYIIEKTERGSRFTWTIAFEPRPRLLRLFKLTDPINKIGFAMTPRFGKRYFAKHP